MEVIRIRKGNLSKLSETDWSIQYECSGCHSILKIGLDDMEYLLLRSGGKNTLSFNCVICESKNIFDAEDIKIPFNIYSKMRGYSNPPKKQCSLCSYALCTDPFCMGDM